jgi:N6-L-threonylcarbamoyladenine synthase
MLVLGIESSCDDTAAAVVENGTKILSSVILDQNTIHSIYGGVVPELAGRSHVEVIDKVIKQALKLSEVSLEEIDLIAVTKGPGLVSSLLVGINTAKALAYALQIPLIGVNHLEGHLLAIFLQEPVKFPFIALTVSGGHTDLYRVNGFGEYIILGRTRDDAAGEAFDKVAKMLNLGYPGGPIIEKKAKLGNSSAHHFPRAFLEKGSLDFSFSGLKTSVRNIISKREELSGFILSDVDIAASFQSAVIEVLSTKLVLACKQQNINRVVVTGGVAANQALRQKVKVECDKNDFQCFFPNRLYCTDNAAMIACAGYYNSCNNFPVVNSFLSLDASSVKSL